MLTCFLLTQKKPGQVFITRPGLAYLDFLETTLGAGFLSSA